MSKLRKKIYPILLAYESIPKRRLKQPPIIYLKNVFANKIIKKGSEIVKKLQHCGILLMKRLQAPPNGISLHLNSWKTGLTGKLHSKVGLPRQRALKLKKESAEEKHLLSNIAMPELVLSLTIRPKRALSHHSRHWLYFCAWKIFSAL